MRARENVAAVGAGAAAGAQAQAAIARQKRANKPILTRATHITLRCFLDDDGDAVRVLAAYPAGLFDALGCTGTAVEARRGAVSREGLGLAAERCNIAMFRAGRANDTYLQDVAL